MPIAAAKFPIDRPSSPSTVASEAAARRIAPLGGPSMHAFELMLGPYAIAHLKVALELHDEGVDDASIQLFLTDTLDHSPAEPMIETMRDPIAFEGAIAAELKLSERFTVVVEIRPMTENSGNCKTWQTAGHGGKEGWSATACRASTR